MAVSLPSFSLQGLSVSAVHVEVDVHSGMPFFAIIGMAGTSVQEAKDRVRSALVSQGFSFPLNRKVVNLAPADLSKNGTHFDLPIALGLLIASGEVPLPSSNILLLGELGLDGSLRGVRGVLPALLFARESGVREVILPEENLKEASLVEGLALYPARNLREVVQHFLGVSLSEQRAVWTQTDSPSYEVDFQDIGGQAFAKRALLVAASGGHHVLFQGSPGTGKTLLGQAFVSILPPLNGTERLEVLRIHSVAGKILNQGLVDRPFRMVHSRATPYALFGGGLDLMPGEVSLAHRGVLFMDELLEFDRRSLELLRQPLEARTLILKQGNRMAHFPCQFQLLATMNPCPCGYFGDGQQTCTCSPSQVHRYQHRLSGPVMDRIDLHLGLSRLEYSDLKHSKGFSSAQMKTQVRGARERQGHRLAPYGLQTNQELTPKLLKEEPLDSETEDFLTAVTRRYALSARAVHRTLKVARSIADLDGQDFIKQAHVVEAFQYRIIM